MEILQMPMLALQERMEQELESNIALEQAEPDTRGHAPDTSGERCLLLKPKRKPMRASATSGGN